MKTKIYMIPGFMNNEKLWSRLTPLFDDNFYLYPFYVTNILVSLKPLVHLK